MDRFEALSTLFGGEKGLWSLLEQLETFSFLRFRSELVELYVNHLFLHHIFLLHELTYKMNNISSALANELFRGLHTFTFLKSKSFLTNETSIVFPIETVLELAHSILQLVVRLACRAQSICRFQTSFDLTNSSLQLIMRKTFGTHFSRVFKAPILHLLASSVTSNVVPTFTSVATIIIVWFTVGNGTVEVFQVEWLVAFSTSVIRFLIFATEKNIMSALTKDQRVFTLALDTVVFRVIFWAELDTFQADSIYSPKSVGTVSTSFSIVDKTSNVDFDSFLNQIAFSTDFFIF